MTQRSDTVDVIDLLLTRHATSGDASLRKEIAAHSAALVALKRHANRDRVELAEQAVSAAPDAAFAFDSTGAATLSVGEDTPAGSRCR